MFKAWGSISGPPATSNFDGLATDRATTPCEKYFYIAECAKNTHYYTAVFVPGCSNMQFFDFNEVDIRMFLPEKVIFIEATRLR